MEKIHMWDIISLLGIPYPSSGQSSYYVQNGYNNLLQLLGDMGFRYGTYLWDPAYKGLDDYIWESLFQKKQSQ